MKLEAKFDCQKIAENYFYNGSDSDFKFFFVANYFLSNCLGKWWLMWQVLLDNWNSRVVQVVQGWNEIYGGASGT